MEHVVRTSLVQMTEVIPNHVIQKLNQMYKDIFQIASEFAVLLRDGSYCSSDYNRDFKKFIRDSTIETIHIHEMDEQDKRYFADPCFEQYNSYYRYNKLQHIIYYPFEAQQLYNSEDVRQQTKPWKKILESIMYYAKRYHDNKYFDEDSYRGEPDYEYSAALLRKANECIHTYKQWMAPP